MKKSPYISRFDSSWSVVLSLARCLYGKDFSGLGIFPANRPFEWMIDQVGDGVRKFAYAVGGKMEALAPDALGDVSAEEISQSIVAQYPKRKYPAVMIGSSDGAAMHLCALMGIPWLPQTYMLPVSQTGLDPDNPRDDMERGVKIASPLLDANPELQLHHMHDPINDRLMIHYFSYFRIKRRRLGTTFRQFLEENLAPGATIFTLECQLKWPVTAISERHYFQVGGVGGVTPEEYVHGGPRVEEFLKRHSSDLRKWDSPEVDSEQPESEWGFETSLLSDIQDLAEQNGYSIRRLKYEAPEALSPVVADIYRWWYEQCSIPEKRLIVEPFILLEPFLVMRERLVPFWVVFNARQSVFNVRRYLENSKPFQNIHVTLFSHGVDAIGLATASDWQEILNMATDEGYFLAANVKKYPADFATFLSYNRELKEAYPDQGVVPALTVEKLDSFVDDRKNDFPFVQLV
jgi:hypothetical protein